MKSDIHTPMKRLLFILLLFCSLTHTVFAQKNTTNNKTKSYSSAKQITKRFDYHREQKDFDSSIYYIDELISLYQAQGDESNVIRGHLRKINVLLQFKKKSEAFKVALITQDKYCGENRKRENCKSCGDIYAKLGEFMTQMQDYRQGIRYLDMNCNKDRNFQYKKALMYNKLALPDSALMSTSKLISMAIESENYWELIGAYNSHGLIATQAGDIDLAIRSFLTSLEYVDSLNLTLNPHRHSFIMGNLGSCYFEKGDFDKAYECLLIDSDGSLRAGQQGSYAMAELSLARIDVHRKDYQVAIKRIESLLLNYDKNINDDQKLEAIEILIQVFKATGNNSKYDYYTDEWIALGKSILKNKLETHQSLVLEYSANSLRLVEEQLVIEKALSAQEKLVLKRDQEKKELVIWLVIAGLVLFVLIFLFFFLRWRSIARVKEAQLKLSQKEQDFLELKVENESKNVQALSLELSVKKDFSKSLVEKLNDFENVSKSDVKNIELFIQNELDIKSTRADLQYQMGDLSSEFYNKLTISYPQLTKLDVKLAAMIAMNMSNKDIAISRNITPGSVRLAKNRLKNKLKLAEEIDLTLHLKNIL